MDLEARFHEAMLQLYHEVVDAKIGNWHPTLLLQSVNQNGGLVTAKKYLCDPDVTEGFIKLWEADRLDLAVEALVLREPWRELFTPDELKVAEQRLGLG